MPINKLKWAAILSFVVSLLFLLGGRFLAKDKYPPYPGKVVGPGGELLFQRLDIIAGQDVYQRG